MIEKKCIYCGGFFKVKPSRINRKYCSTKCYYKSKFGTKNLKTTGNNHWAWKEKPAYSSVHDWVRHKKGNVSKYKCAYCEKKAKDWANINHKYYRNLDDYIPLCRSCHIKYDKNISKLR